jgi:hypothetical protein
MRQEKAPDGARRSEDGRFWWDGQHSEWVLDDPHEIEMEMGDDDPGSYHVATDADVRVALLHEFEQRLHEYQTEVHSAVIAFQAHAARHINELPDHDAEADFSPVASAMGTALRMIFAARAVAVFTNLLQLDSQLVDAVNAHQSGIAGAQKRLTSALDAFVEAYTQKSADAWQASKANLTGLVEEVLSELDDKTMTVRPEFIKAACDGGGIYDPVATGVHNTVRQQLEAEFVGVYERVRAEIYNDRIDTYGRKVNPDAFERETVEEERKLYKEEGVKAWEHEYELIDPGL